VGGDVVESVDQFLYFGSLQFADAGLVADVGRSVGLAAGCRRSLNNIWISRRIKTATKVRIYWACVMAVLLYGSEIWTLTKASSSKLQSFFMRCQRQIMCVRWFDFVSNVTISSATGLGDVG